MSPVLPFHYVRESRKCSASPGTDRPGDNCGQTCWNHSEVVLAVPQLWFFTVREQEKLQIYFYFDTQLKAEGRGRMRCEQSRVSTMFRQVSSAVNLLKPVQHQTSKTSPLYCGGSLEPLVFLCWCSVCAARDKLSESCVSGPGSLLFFRGFEDRNL